MQEQSNSNENQRRLAEEKGRNINYGSFTRKPLNPPPLDEVKQILESALSCNFDEANVSVGQCPDLREPPFYLTASGLCGNTVAMEFGGLTFPGYDEFSSRKSTWNLPSTLNSICPRSLFAIGAYENYSNDNFYEITANFSCSPNHDTVMNNNYYTTYQNKHIISKFDTSSEFLRCDKHGTLFISDGNQGDVLKVHVKGRQNVTNFVSVMYTVLKNRYEFRLIALGGTFVVNEGMVKHAFPNFCNDFYYDTSTPLIAVGTIFNTNTFTHANLSTSKITCEHFHTFTHNATFRGGHFVNDTKPRTIEYEGYFNLASEFICVDPIIIPRAYN